MQKTDSATHTTCDRCGVSVPFSDLRQGLAIRIKDEVVCSSCVDALPSDTQIKINQLRAVRGMDSTTYRVSDDFRPQTNVFTFSTSINLIKHRHQLKTSGRFEAPPLPKDQRAVSQRSEIAKFNKNHEKPTRKSPRLYLTAAAVCAAAVIFGIILWPANDTAQALSTSEQAAKIEQERLNKAYAALALIPDPVQALRSAKDEHGLAVDDPVVLGIYKQIIEQKTRELDAADEALKDGEFERSRELAARTALPAGERRFTLLKDRQEVIEKVFS